MTTALLNQNRRLLQPCPPLRQNEPVQLQVCTLGGKTTLHLCQPQTDHTARNLRTETNGTLQVDVD